MAVVVRYLILDRFGLIADWKYARRLGIFSGIGFVVSLKLILIELLEVETWQYIFLLLCDRIEQIAFGFRGELGLGCGDKLVLLLVHI